MKQIAWLFSSVVILWSCNSSVKGDWSDSDMNACIESGKKEIEHDNEFKSIIAMFTDNENEFIECCCRDFEKDFDSWASYKQKLDKGMGRVTPQIRAGYISASDPLFKEDDYKTLQDCFGDRFKAAMEALENGLYN